MIKLKKGDDLGVGSIRHYIWKSKLPYRLTFETETVRVEPMSVLEGIARRELDGRAYGIFQPMVNTQSQDTTGRCIPQKRG